MKPVSLFSPRATDLSACVCVCVTLQVFSVQISPVSTLGSFIEVQEVGTAAGSESPDTDPTLSSERARMLLLRQGLASRGWDEFGVSIRTARSRGHCPLTRHLFPSQQREAFKKRWFTLDHRRLMYFKDPLVRARCDRRQLQAAVLGTGSKCTQSLCSAVRAACRFPSCYEWTPGLPLSTPFSSSRAFCVCFTACKQWEQGGQQCKGGDGTVTQRDESSSSSLRPLEIHGLIFSFSRLPLSTGSLLF